MPVTIKTADKIERAKHLRCLVIGAPGAGKTELAATFPNPFFCDCDNGLRTLKTPGFKRRHPDVDLSKIKFASVSEEVNEFGMFTKAQAVFDALNAMEAAIEDPEVETIVLDSLTSFSFFAMNIGLELNAKIGSKGKSQSLSFARQHNFLNLTQADFGAQMNVIQQVFDKLTSNRVRKHVIVLAHEKITKSKDGDMILKREPLITGDALRGNIGRWFDDVWFIETTGTGKDATRTLKPESDFTRASAKSRSGLEEEIENPTYEKIMAALS